MNEDKPLVLPKGITQVQINTLPVDKGEWRKSEMFVCRACKSPAYLNPYTNIIWGCKKCRYTTTSPFLFFVPVGGSWLHPVTSK